MRTSFWPGHRDVAGVYLAFANSDVDVHGLVTNAAATGYVHMNDFAKDAPSRVKQAFESLATNLSLEERVTFAYRIAVTNRGPALPETMQGRLFDSMVSVRDRRGPLSAEAKHQVMAGGALGFYGVN